MNNINDFIGLMKKGSVEAVAESKPTDILYGLVISENPLKVKIESKFILGEKQLELTSNTRDTEVEISIEDLKTDNSDEFKIDNSKKDIEIVKLIKKKITIHNKLKIGDKLLLLRKSGGQKFIALDKL